MRILKDTTIKHFITEDGLKLQYEITNNNNSQMLFFLHGLGGDLTNWDAERIIFHKLGFSTAALDMRGHGVSDHAKKQSDYTLDVFAQDILQLIHREKMEGCILIGHCLGGMVAITFAGMHPKLLKALILIDTNYKSPVLVKYPIIRKLTMFAINIIGRILPNNFIRNYKKRTHWRYYKDWSWPGVFDNMRYMSLRDWLFAFEDIVGLDLKQLLKNIKIPTLVVTGSEDTIFLPQMAKEIHELIEGSELQTIPKGNHSVPNNNVEELSTIMHRFIKKIT